MSKVLVSGANGFIGAHTVQQLLDAGHEVIGTVRNPDNDAKVGHLKALDGAAERLTLVAADLNAADAFDQYVQDVEYVLHTASPYVINVKDPQSDLVDPAVNGTLSMMRACAKAPNLKRVVLTSSMAAVTDEPDANVTLTEDIWNDKSSLERNPYYYSKTLAEKAAWDFVEQEKPGWDLVVINPFMVVGPAFSDALNESNKILADIIKGSFPAIMALEWGFVDVRDVAKAHVLAMTAENAKGRYLCVNEKKSMRELCSFLRDNGFAGFKVPKMGLDSGFGTKVALWTAFTQPKFVATYLRSHLGRALHYNNSKIQQDLELKFRDTNQTILDACADMQQWNHIPKAA